MRKFKNKGDGEEAEIDLTPMLDVVFIMLIFFIVVASFIKEAGIEVNRPDNTNSDPSDATSILIRIAGDNQVWMENRRVDVRSVRANVQRLLAEDPDQPVTIKTETGAEMGVFIEVADAAREAGASVTWPDSEQ
ncbi:ExbD/TolR family protein [Halioglobus pacificus]|uniref:Biopolymer transporter ExbD n=1 Tax=Parahalioglobus pacificus TaxID=930806 RepID=A0A919CL40_9GAMM|nr:biopolymer transporter ExbD [Halioglobus pacificus]NQY04466.1 biopolymer transporter ExbD [Halieaceae bacterium]GHD35389.1 biopolymer transporter ExbD [Halioglobus pacificus]